MKTKRVKTLAEAIQEVVTPDIMATIRATEKHKEEADKAHKEADDKGKKFVKDTEKAMKEAEKKSKKLTLSEDYEEDEYINVFSRVYGDLTRAFPDAERHTAFNRKETEGTVKFILDRDDIEEAKAIAGKYIGVNVDIDDNVITVTAPTKRKASDSVTVHDLFDEIHAQLTADGDKYDIWGKESDNKGVGYLAGEVAGSQIGEVGGDFDRDTITVTVHADDKENGRVYTLDPAIEIVNHYKDNGVTYSIKPMSNGDKVMTITIPDAKAPLKDPRVKYGANGRPMYQASKRKKVEESKKLTEDNYGWQVKPGEEEALYEELCYAWGADDVNMQIVQAMGTQELGEYLEFICRMNDFDSVHFEGHEEDEEELEEAVDIVKRYVVRHNNGKYVSKDFNVGSFDRAAKFATEEEAENFISDGGKDSTWSKHFTVVDTLNEGKRTKDDPWGLM